MPIQVASRRKSPATLAKMFPHAILLDVTSRAGQPWVRFSPFYPHGDIPLPLAPEQTAQSVEGIWQGLKVFERADVDPGKFAVTNMRGLKRTTRSFGNVLGHRPGPASQELLGYYEARCRIYLPTYRWVLDHRLQDEIATLRQISAAQTVVLLDYETNDDITNLASPLSHAALIAAYLADRWPTR